jgi:hypothetical protein
MIITWNLSAAPSQQPDYWMLFVDGAPWCSLAKDAPYTGAGSYKVDLVASPYVTPIPPGPHSIAVALVGQGVTGPPCPPISVTIPLLVITTVQPPPPPVWPVADTLTST